MAEKAKKHFLILHNPKLCKACGLCYAYCPKKVIEPDVLGHAHYVHIQQCIGCKKCVWICPDFANWVELAEGADETELRIAGEDD